MYVGVYMWINMYVRRYAYVCMSLIVWARARARVCVCVQIRKSLCFYVGICMCTAVEVFTIVRLYDTHTHTHSLSLSLYIYLYIYMMSSPHWSTPVKLLAQYTNIVIQIAPVHISHIIVIQPNTKWFCPKHQNNSNLNNNNMNRFGWTPYLSEGANQTSLLAVSAAADATSFNVPASEILDLPYSIKNG